MNLEQIEALQQLKSLDDDRELVSYACFYVCWKLRSPNSWDYSHWFIKEEGVVTLDKLIEAIQAKRDRLAEKELCTTPSYTKLSKSRR